MRTDPHALFVRIRDRIALALPRDKPAPQAPHPPAKDTEAASPPTSADDSTDAISDPNWRPIEPPTTALPAMVSAPLPCQPGSQPLCERVGRELGTFRVEGQNFTVKLSLVCFKQNAFPQGCEDETLESVQVEDESGRQHFKQSFPIHPPAVSERDLPATSHEVTAIKLEGQEHEALALLYQERPSAPRTGGSYQILALRDGMLRPMNRKPAAGGVEDLADLPEGRSENSKQLLEGDIFSALSRNHYVSYVEPVRINWKGFRLEVPSLPDFEVRFDPAASREMGGVIHIFQSPEKTSTRFEIAVTNDSKMQILRIRLGSSSGDHEPANRDWLKIRVDDSEGWILGKHDYDALGLGFVE